MTGDIETRLRQRLALDEASARKVFDGAGIKSDFDLNPHWTGDQRSKHLRPAAVLIGLIKRGPDDFHVLLTKRADDLASHAGQVSFPGGRIDDGDPSPLAAALREAQEEIGLAPDLIEPIGYLDTYETGTGFRILPVVGFVDPQAEFVPHPGEVAAIFDVPLRFLMDPQNHERHAREYGGRTRHFFAFPYQDYYIWGATAGMLVNLWERVFAD